MMIYDMIIVISLAKPMISLGGPPGPEPQPGRLAITPAAPAARPRPGGVKPDCLDPPAQHGRPGFRVTAPGAGLY
jgi:hypothetical protein